MSQKLSRRSFLKTAGAVAVAAAAMSTLTACGGGGSSTPDPKPTPSTPTTPVTLGGIEIQDAGDSRGYWSNQKVPYKWFIYLDVTIKNTSNKDILLGDLGIKAKLDSIDRTPSFAEKYIGGDDKWINVYTSTPLKAGESMKIAVAYEISEETFNDWNKGDHSFEATLIYGGKKVTYSRKTGKLGNVENA